DLQKWRHFLAKKKWFLFVILLGMGANNVLCCAPAVGDETPMEAHAEAVAMEIPSTKVDPKPTEREIGTENITTPPSAPIPQKSPRTTNAPIPKSDSFPPIKTNETLTSCSRALYFSKNFSWRLGKQFPTIFDETRDPQSFATQSTDVTKTHLTNLMHCLNTFVVGSTDLLLQHLPPKKRTQEACETIYCEITRLALEQIFPVALNLGCLPQLIHILTGRNHTMLKDDIRAELKKTIHIASIKDNSEEIKVEFSSKHADFILEKLRLQTNSYEQIFTDFADENIYQADFLEKMHHCTNAVRNAIRALQPTVSNGFILDKLANIIVSESNRIAEKCPNKDIPDIYKTVIQTTLQHVLPVISCSGRLWIFANALKDRGKEEKGKPFNRKLKSSFEEHAPYILAQPRGHSSEREKLFQQLKKQLCPDRAPSDENASTQENNPNTSFQDTMALLLSQVQAISEQNEKSAEKKYIKQQMHHINTALCETIRTYFDVFAKRETFGKAPSPL
ncbi:MAG: hypothetical protein LBN94_00965, partial [Puniceicoccales bacterium]|nr:hypothetical protein [Puniceicoccales bacterium]